MREALETLAKLTSGRRRRRRVACPGTPSATSTKRRSERPDA